MNEPLTIPLVIEGLTDAVFFQHLIARLFLTDSQKTIGIRGGRLNVPTGVTGISTDGREVEVDFYILDGKHQSHEVISTFFDTGVTKFAIALDIDRGTATETADSIRDMVRSVTGDGVAEVHVIPIGLPDDPTLHDLGIAKHEMEDYLISLALQDEGLREHVPQLQQALEEILPIVRDKDGPFDSGKEIFQIVKPLVQLGFSDTALAETFVTKAGPDVLKSVLAPLLDEIEKSLEIRRLT